MTAYTVDHRLKAVMTDHAAAVLALVDVLRAARALRYEAPLERKTTTAGVSDPTGEIATSTSRLRLAASIEDSLAHLEAATETLRRASARLSDVLATHAERPDLYSLPACAIQASAPESKESA